MAKHLAHYFRLENIDFIQWKRNENILFEEALKRASKILLAIKDDAIESFLDEHFHQKSSDQIFVHFSGALSFNKAEGAHPLMTFSERLYSLNFYRTIPFVLERGGLDFKTLFPELKNPSFKIAPEEKTLYHAWCVIGGNFPVILMQKFQEEMRQNFGLPKETLIPYLKAVFENFFEEENSLTGPFVRRDFQTIKKHDEALKNTDFAEVYAAFVKFFWKREIGVTR